MAIGCGSMAEVGGAMAPTVPVLTLTLRSVLHLVLLLVGLWWVYVYPSGEYSL